MPVSSLGNILLIDDNPKLIKDTLPMYGYHTDCTENGIFGLEFWKKLSKY